MTLDELTDRSVGETRILVDIDITQLNQQWVNAGAGVWYCNKDAIYQYVDSSLLSWFTAQTMPNVGSVRSDEILLLSVDSLLLCSETEESFFWDGSNLYIHLQDHTSPYLHTINIGVVYGVSNVAFTPIGSVTFYEGRLLSVPSISKSRDPLFFGRLQYDGGSVDINNADGFFDQFGEDNDAYGNQVRVYLGYADLDISDYYRLYTGTIDTLRVSENELSITLADTRRQLSKQIIYTATNKNCLECIEEILFDNYSIPYNDLYFNQLIWEVAKTKAPNITINMTTTGSAIELIEEICATAFGIFLIDPDGRYSFKIILPGDAATYTIPEEDILNNPTATYNPAEVISSTKVGYARDWTKTGASAYTYLTDTSQEDDIYQKYRTYKQRTFDTLLINGTAAQTYSDNILDYSGLIRPTLEIEVPIKYYKIDVGDFADVTINRLNATFFGERKCEIIRKVYNLDRDTITFTVRKYGGEIAYRVTTDGYYRFTTEDELRKVGQ